MLLAQGLEVRRGARVVLHKLDLQLQAGEVLGVLGPNGAGKSSLLKALSGELAPASGKVLLDGRALPQWPDRQRAQHLAILPQESHLEFGFAVEEVVAMGRLPHEEGVELDRQALQVALDWADIGHLRGRSYLSLSGGERQRVHLARVLAQAWPASAQRTLLLDEPTAMLDPLHQHGVLQVARELAGQGAAVLVILHDLNLAARYCDRLLLLKDGRNMALGSPWQVLQVDTLRSVFGLEVLLSTHPERGHPVVVAR